MQSTNGLPITTPRMILRRVLPEDADALLEIYSNEANMKYEFGDPWSADQVAEFIYSQSTIRVGDPGVPFTLVAADSATGSVMGSVQITINSIEDRQGELGFSFNPAYCGRGLATEAVNACLGFAYSRMNLHRIIAAVDVRNERSWKLLARIGMRREAHFIHDNFVDGEWVDDYVYALLKTEWNEKNGL